MFMYSNYRLFFAATMMALLLGISPKLRAAGALQVVFLKGNVYAIDELQQKMPVKVNQQLFAGQSIETGAESLAVLKLEDGSSIKVEENAQIIISELISKGASTEANGVSRLILKLGSLMINAVQQFTDKSSLEISSESGVSFGVRGTMFMVFKEKESKDIWSVVREGTIWAVDQKKNDMEVIEAGSAMVLLNGTELTQALNYSWTSGIDWKSLSSNSVATPELIKNRLEERKLGVQSLTKRQKKPIPKNISKANVQYSGGTGSSMMQSSSSESNWLDAGGSTTEESADSIVNGSESQASNAASIPNSNISFEQAFNLAKSFCQGNIKPGFSCKVSETKCVGQIQNCKIEIANKPGEFVYCCIDIDLNSITPLTSD